MRMPDEFISDLDKRVYRLGLSESVVLREAGLASRYFADIRAGRRPLTRKTYERMCAAISDLQKAKAINDRYAASRAQAAVAGKSLARHDPITAQYRLLLWLVCTIADVPPGPVMAADPAKRATADSEWMQAAHLRRIAIYIANAHLNIKQADLARAAGLSRAAVCGMLKDMEDLRGDAQVQTMIGAVEEVFL